MSEPPTTTLVAVAWLKGVAGISSSQVATRLPATSSWTDNSFLTVPEIIGGSPHLELPISRPVVGVHAWAVNPNGGKPPLNRANRLLELVKIGAWAEGAHRTVVIGSGYDNARVTAVIPLVEPRRHDNDPSSYAHFSVDVAFHWVRVPAS